VEFIRLPTFERAAAGLLSEMDVLELELALLANPAVGDLISTGHGLRKVRRPMPGRGKRGGARVIYYHIPGRTSSTSSTSTPRVRGTT